ncbi:glycerophosphodiester phosphodiesterase [Microbulbifer discodermiae]|uniref:glycerophosphodiester phosphodiesterase n=1 Tax=Microbulbifer sp. 2201CG32-9 TaxID=3232309 RepID=UPI00345B8082
MFSLRSLCSIAAGLLLAALAAASPAQFDRDQAPLVIAHRGASGYLPEHTLESKALAYGMRPDYIEQDLVLSKDDHLIVLHDIYLDHVTDVADVFPHRARPDGHFYTIDFTLEEIKRLRVTEAFDRRNGETVPRYPQRFPLWRSSFKLATLAEEIEMIQGLNLSLGYDIGIYPEIKNPAFHHREGKDIAKLTLALLKQYGYDNPQQKIFLQSFDAEELQRIERELLPRMNMSIPLVQLIALTSWGTKKIEVDGQLVNYNYDWMLEEGGLKRIAGYADAIGPWAMMLVQKQGDNFGDNGVVARAHAVGLAVHPYTFRADDLLLPTTEDFEELVRMYTEDLGVDGLFTDHPDKVRDYLHH